MTTQETVPSCTLQADEASSQFERWRALARAATGVERSAHEIRMLFGDDAPVATVREVIAVERACCPFFSMSYADGVLRMGVEDAEHAPALDAVAERLGVS